MNSILKDGEVFTLKNLLPYQDGKIVNMDLIDQEKDKDKLKLTVMSFAAGTALPEHTISAEALLCALDGEAVISYAGKEHTIHAGENFKFAKGVTHSVRAAKPFKMALLTTLE